MDKDMDMDMNTNMNTDEEIGFTPQQKAVVTDEKLIALFSREGKLGCFGARYKGVKTDSAMIYETFCSYAASSRIFPDPFTPSDITPYFPYITKRSYFRPTDEIWTFDGIIPRPGKVSRLFKHYVPSLFALVNSCNSFIIDADAAGSDYEQLGEREYFVLPENAKSKASRLSSLLCGFRRCGMITSDAVPNIRIVRGGVTESITVSEILSLRSEPDYLRIDSPEDFNAGLVNGACDALETLSPFVFPFDRAKTRLCFSSVACYRLGHTISVSGLTNTEPPLSKQVFGNPEGLYVSYLPVMFDNSESLRRSLQKAVFFTAASSRSCSCFSAAFGGIASDDMFEGYTVDSFIQPPENRPGFIFLSDKPLNILCLGRLVRHDSQTQSFTV